MQTWLVTAAANGLGQALAIELAQRHHDVALVLTARDESSLMETVARLPRAASTRTRVAALDLTSEKSCVALAERLRTDSVQLRGLINAAGFLHSDSIKPEKRIEDFSLDALLQNTSANAGTLAMLAKHFYKLMPRDERAVLASLSARVGSISDNRLGGWYSYRASKAAHNMLVRGLAIELGRRYKQLICVGLHPGTVDTQLSAPFQRGVAADKLFTASQSANHLLDVIDALSAQDSGKVFDWAGAEVPA